MVKKHLQLLVAVVYAQLLWKKARKSRCQDVQDSDEVVSACTAYDVERLVHLADGSRIGRCTPPWLAHRASPAPAARLAL